MLRRNHIGIVAGMLLVLLSLAGCSQFGIEEPGEVEVTSEQYKDFWAFTVEEGILTCLNPTGRRRGEAVFIAGGVTYAFNETALAAGHPSVEPIRKDSPDARVGKIPMQQFVTVAENECK